MAGCLSWPSPGLEEGVVMLYQDFMEPCVLVEKTKAPDGESGFTQVWPEGAPFDAAIVTDNSMEARVGQKAGVTSVYTVTVKPGLGLEYHDVFKRVSDSKIFRVTSDSDDKKTPKVSTFQFEQVTAEEWELTT